MREAADLTRIRRFMSALGEHSHQTTRVYLTGGATAVLHGWRDSTIDVDLKFVPERDDLLRAIPELKEQLRLNVELASPADFIPVRSNWEDRSPFIVREGKAFFHHFDLCAQALSKIERNHDQDARDVEQMLRTGLVTRQELGAYFEAVAPQLYRFPAIDPQTFRERVRRVVAREEG